MHDLPPPPPHRYDVDPYYRPATPPRPSGYDPHYNHY